MWRRDRSYNFYAQLVSDLEEGKTRLPIRLQFKRTSWKTGKQIASFSVNVPWINCHQLLSNGRFLTK